MLTQKIWKCFNTNSIEGTDMSRIKNNTIHVYNHKIIFVKTKFIQGLNEDNL